MTVSNNYGSKSVFKQIIIVLLVLAVLAAIGSANDEKDKNLNQNVTPSYNTVYLVPSSTWKSDSSGYVAWCWNSQETSFPAGFVKGTDINYDGVIEFNIPSPYTNVIFIDVKPGVEFNGNWDNKREQTSDLKLPTDSNVYYHVSDNAWKADSTSTEVENVENLVPVTVSCKSSKTWTSLYVFNKNTDDATFLTLTNSNYSGFVRCSATIPPGYTHCIFILHYDSTSVGTWEQVEKQTEDLPIPTDNNTAYDFMGGTGWHDDSLYSTAE